MNMVAILIMRRALLAFRFWFGLLLLLIPRQVSAQSVGCDSAQIAWIEQIVQGSGERIQLQRCNASTLWIQIPSSETAMPITVEISEGEGPAFRRVGALKFSPVMNGDWARVPADQRASFDALIQWVTNNPHRKIQPKTSIKPSIFFSKPSTVPSWPLRLLVALLLAGVGWFLSRTSLRCTMRTGISMAALIVFALGLRGGWGLWGPYHINGQGPLWIEMAWRGTSLPTYGAGYSELYHGLASLQIPPDTAIFMANTLLSSLLPVLLFLLVRLLGAPWIGAIVASAALVIDPISIHMAATESYFVPIQALLLLAIVMGGAARIVLRDNRWLGAAAFSLAAGLVVAQLFRVHPLAWPLLSTLPFFWGGVPSRRGGLRRVMFEVAFIGFISLTTAVLTLGNDALVPLQELRRQRTSTSDFSLLKGLLLLSIAAAFLLLKYKSRPHARSLRTFELVSVTLGLSWTLFLRSWLHTVYGQSQVWQRSFDIAYWVLVTAMVVTLVSPRTRGGVALLVLPWGGYFVLSLWQGAPTTTEVLEYRWLRAELAKLEPNAMIVHVERSKDRVLTIPEYALRGASTREVRNIKLSPQRENLLRFLPDTPYYYLHGSLCEGVDQQETCTKVESSFDLAPIATTILPAVASHNSCPYSKEEVSLSLSRIARVRNNPLLPS